MLSPSHDATGRWPENQRPQRYTRRLAALFASRFFLGFAFGMAAFGMAPVRAQGISALKKHNVDQPIDITADELEVQTKNNTATFRGHVDAVQSDLKLQADRVTVYYRNPVGDEKLPNKDASQISRIDASGNVILSSPTETVRSNWGVYDLDMKIVTLGGSVVMTKGGNNIRGDRLQLDLTTGVTRIEGGEGAKGSDQGGRVRGRFVPPVKKN